MAADMKDNRIVEMQFDSRDFDRNIRKSQKTLEDFKKSLNFDNAVEQMQEVGQASGILEGMAANLKKLTQEMVGIGTISGFVKGKIKKAWQDAANSVEGFTKSLTTAQKVEGEAKYDKLLKSVQTIKNATGDAEEYVYQVLDDLNRYTDETSYNFSDMAQNIGKFTTAGVGLKDAETEMEGIANWAALAGQGVNEAQRAMYNISQAMSAGYMLKIDYKSIQNANMDIRKFREEALKAAAEVGTLIEKNGEYRTKQGNKIVNMDNFAETLQFKWFDKKAMEKVFKVFADNTQGIGAEAYKAAQRCVTMKDALQAIKDMLSTGWMKTYESIFGKLSDAMNLFSGLCNKAEEALAKFMETRNSILEHWSTTGRDSLWGALVGEIETPDGDILYKGAYGLLDALSDVSDMIYDAFWDFTRMFVDDKNLGLFDSDPEYKFAFLGAGLTTLTNKVKAFIGGIKDFFHEVPEGATESRFDRIKHVVEAIYATVMMISLIGKGIAQFVGEILNQLSPAFYAVESLISFLMQLFTGKVVQAAKNNSIGNFFHNLAESLRPVTGLVNAVVVSIANLVGRIVAFVHQSGLLPALMSVFSRVFGAISGALKKTLSTETTQGFVNWMKNLAENIPAAVQKLKDFGKSILETVKNTKAFGTFWNWAKTTFSGKSLSDVWKTISGRFSALVKEIPTLLPILKGKIGAVWRKIVGVLDEMFGGIIGFFASSAKAEEASESVNKAIVAALTPGGSTDNPDGAAAEAANGIIGRIKSVFDRVWEPIKGFFNKFFGETIPNFFKSDAVKTIGKFFSGTTFMGLLGGATNLVKWLAIFRTGSGLVSAGKGIKKLGTGIKVFGKNLKNLNLVGAFKDMFNFTNIINSQNTDNSRTTNWGKFGSQLLQIAIGIGLVTFAAIKLAEIDPEKLKHAGLALAAMLGGLVIAGWAAKKLTNGSSLLKIAIALDLLLIPLKALMAMPLFGASGGIWDGLIGGGIKLAALMLALAVCGRIAGTVKLKGFAAFGLAVNLLLHPLRALMKMPFLGETGGLIKSMGALVILMTAMAGASRLAGGKGLKGMLGLAIAMNLLLIPIKMLGNMPLDKLAQGVGAIEILILSMGALAAVTKGQKMTSMAGLVLAIGALAVIGTIVGKMDWKQVLTGFGPIILIMGMMAVMVRAASKLDPAQIKGVQKIFTTFALMIGIIAASMLAISVLGVPESTILEFFGGIVATLLSLGIAVKLAQKTDAKAIGKLALIFGMLALVIGVITGSLILMKKMDIGFDMLVTMMAGITAIIVAMGIFLPLLSKMNPLGALVAVGAIALAIAAIMGVIGLMADYLLGSVGNALGKLSGRLKNASGLLKDFFDRMDSISEDSVRHAGLVFDLVKDLVMKFSSFSVYNEGIDALLIQMNQLGAGLDLFFLNDSKYPDPENSKAFMALNKFLEIGPQLAEFSIGNMASQIFSLGAALGLFNSATAGITNENPPALALLQGLFGQADNIAAFSALPLGDISAKMTELGGAMKLYAKGAAEVTGLDEGDTVGIEDAVEILNGIVGAMNAEGGLSDFTIPEGLPDETSLGEFGAQLAALAMALDEFIRAANGMDDNTDKAIAALGFMQQLNTDLTKDKIAFVNAFSGAGVDYDVLNVFALDIGALGYALSEFATQVAGQDFSNGLTALNQLQELNSKLTSDKLAFVNAFTDAGVSDSILSQFATDIAELGRALGSFAQNLIMDDGSEANFTHALHALNFMTVLQNKLPQVGGLHELLEGHKKTLGELSGDIQEIGQGLHDFSDKMKGAGIEGQEFDYDAVMLGFNALAGLIDVANNLSSYNLETGYGVGAEFYIEQLTTLMKYLNNADYWLTSGNGKTIAENMAEFAASLTTAFGKAGEIDLTSIQTFSTLAQGLTDLMSLDPSLDFAYPGKMIAAGIAQGIREGKSDVVNAVVEVVSAGILAGNETAGIASPSRVFAEMGRYMNLGLVDGLTQNQGEVEDASGGLVSSAVAQALNMMSVINSVMEETSGLQPTITPILDLSNVEAQSQHIGQYLNRGWGLDLTNALNRATEATQNGGPSTVFIQNPTDLSGIQAAISTLQTDIENLGVRISNMQLVLNTGVVAGGVTDGVDLNIGRKSLYASRRN